MNLAIIPLSWVLVSALSLSIESPEGLNEILTEDQEQVEKGLALLQKHCYTCHNPASPSHDEMLAPPLVGIKSHYQKAYPESKEFKAAMIGFVSDPSEEKGIMKGPMKRFGVMPKPPVPEVEIKLIVDYIQANQLEEPSWFKEHHKGNGNPNYH